MNIRYKCNYVASLLKRYGFRGLVMKTLERSMSPMRAYTNCYKHYLAAAEELQRQRKTPLSYAPLISIVVPAYETAEVFLCELLDSVMEQTYPNWELCIADGSKSRQVEEFVDNYGMKDSRIRYVHLDKNGGISENTNAGFAVAKGEYIAMMDHDDILTPNALYEMVKCISDKYRKEERKYALVYSDEDKVDAAGKVHSRPHFKPDYNPEFLRRNNYFCHFLLFSASLLKETRGLRLEYDGAQDYDFVLRCVEAGAIISHVPKILYHWRIHEGSTAGNSADKAYAFDAGCRAIEGHLKRIGEPGKASTMANLGVYRVEYELKGSYRLTVVTKEQEQLKRIREHYKNAAVCQPENSSGYYLDIHYMLADQLNDTVLSECIGDYVLSIGEKVHPKLENLIEGMLGICQHEWVGITAAKLYTRRGKVASCGMIYKEDGMLVQSCGGIFKEYKGYFLHAVIPQNVSAACFCCVMLKREAIKTCGGVDTEETGIYRDADVSFRLGEVGYQIVVTPEVSALMEMEGQINSVEISASFQKKWKKKLKVPDPGYNLNLSQRPRHTYAMKE